MERVHDYEVNVAENNNSHIELKDDVTEYINMMIIYVWVAANLLTYLYTASKQTSSLTSTALYVHNCAWSWRRNESFILQVMCLGVKSKTSQKGNTDRCRAVSNSWRSSLAWSVPPSLLHMCSVVLLSLSRAWYSGSQPQWWDCNPGFQPVIMSYTITAPVEKCIIEHGDQCTQNKDHSVNTYITNKLLRTTCH